MDGVARLFRNQPGRNTQVFFNSENTYDKNQGNAYNLAMQFIFWKVIQNQAEYDASNKNGNGI